MRQPPLERTIVFSFAGYDARAYPLLHITLTRCAAISACTHCIAASKCNAECRRAWDCILCRLSAAWKPGAGTY